MAVDQKTTLHVRALREIFFAQIGLLLLLAILFIIGNFFTPVGTLFFGVTLGAIGASVSLLNRVRNNLVENEAQFVLLKVFAVLIPILYGSVMSGIAYLFFMSGILSGEGGGGLLVSNLFPNFGTPADPNENILKQFMKMSPDGLQETGKLLVWCFLAGYSERFVTDILNQLGNKVGAKGDDDDEEEAADPKKADTTTSDPKVQPPAA